MNKKNFKIYVTLIISIVFYCNFINIVNANENNDKELNFGTLNELNYSTEYKKWLELPEKEKNNYIMPSMYNIDLDVEEIKNNSEIIAESSTLPEKYSLKDSLNINVRNQEKTNFCWAFASSKVFETTYAKLNNKTNISELSPRHMVYATSKYFNDNVENPMGFNREVNEGGNYYQAVAYWANGSGPVLENDMPFVNSMGRINISEIQNKTVQAQLEDARFFSSIYKSYDSLGNATYSNGSQVTYTKSDIETFRNMIKTQIMKYGAVAAMTYTPIMEDKSDFYYSNDGLSYYCNNTKLLANHAIVIVGWDDTYSKTNFKTGCQPTNDGAYIALNSYGNFNLNDGYYYISYDDYFVENGMFGIQNVSDKDYDNIYQYDELGMIWYLFASNTSNNALLNKIYTANCFNKKSSLTEKLSEVGIYIYNNNTDVSIYLNKNGKNFDISKLDLIATADNLTAGYHVIDLKNKITVGNTFSIVVKYTNDYGALAPIELPLVELYNTASANAGESYASVDGNTWVDITMIDASYSEANACIKAFTINSTETSSDTEYIENTNWKIVKGNNNELISGINEKTTISELLSSTNYKSGYTVKAYKNGVQVTTGNVTTGTVIKIYEGSNIVKEYTIVIYGDTDCDGYIASNDALMIIKNALGKLNLKDEICLEAGRVSLGKRNTNENPTAVDALAVIKHKLNKEKISQK